MDGRIFVDQSLNGKALPDSTRLGRQSLQEAPKKVVLIMTDTQRKDMLGCYGNQAMHTPNLDRLAADGVRFERAYTCQPVCGPARAALFTGTWPHINNCWGNSMAPDIKTRTVGKRVADEGLHAAYIGKWHLDGWDYFGDGRCPAGWDPDYWYDMRRYLDELPEDFRRASRREETSYAGDGISDDQTFGYRVSNRAVDFLKKHGQEDFLLVVSFDEPHGPFLTPQRFLKMHRDTKLPWNPNMIDSLARKPEHQKIWAKSLATDDAGRSETSLALKFQSLFACNSFVDEQIGRVVEAVDKYAPSALVVYTSDHGDMLESHRLTNKGPVMYEEITNVPLLVRWPGVVPPGGVSSHLMSHIDVVPTILDVLGCEKPSGVLHGKSMVPDFLNAVGSGKSEVFMEFGRYEIDHDGFGGFQPIRCVRNERYKLVINLLAGDEFYDLAQDPGEMTNLIESVEHSPARDTLHDRLIDWMNETRDPFRGYYWLRRPWRSNAPEPTWEFTGCTRQQAPDLGEDRPLDYDTGMPVKALVRKKSENYKPTVSA